MKLVFASYLSYWCVRPSKGSENCANLLQWSCTAFKADTKDCDYHFITSALSTYIHTGHINIRCLDLLPPPYRSLMKAFNSSREKSGNTKQDSSQIKCLIKGMDSIRIVEWQQTLALLRPKILKSRQDADSWPTLMLLYDQSQSQQYYHKLQSPSSCWSPGCSRWIQTTLPIPFEPLKDVCNGIYIYIDWCPSDPQS